MQNTRQWLVGAVLLAVFAALSVSLWVMYRELRRVQGSLGEIQQVQKDLSKITDHPTIAKVDISPAKKQRWSALQSKSQNAVMQVFSEINEFNWVEPYKTPTQKKIRGSAFFISDQGEIITNAHVVNQAIFVAVQIPSIGKRRFAVDVIGVSPERDLALLKLPEKELVALKKELGTDTLPYLTFSDSDAVKRGDKIMALGFPLGQEGLKSTTGVVSGREHLAMSGYFIQISAPINPGSSGGPSLDQSGRVIGVNTAGIPGAQNVDYIKPANEVLLFLDQLGKIEEDSKTKLLRKPFLGVFFNSANDDLRAYLKNPPPGGLYVVDAYKGSPFDKAGIKAGDMIYSIDGYSVDMHGEMQVPWSKEDRISISDYVARLKLGHEIRLTYYRKGKKMTTSFKLEHSEPPIRTMYPGFEKIEYEMLAGFVFMPITLNHVILLAKYAPKLVQYADPTKPIKPALFITHTLLNSPASRLRTLGAGGIISEVNGQNIQTLDDFRSAVLQSATTGYLTIKTTDNQFAAISLTDILADEERLASMYYYPVSELFKELKTRVKKNELITLVMGREHNAQ